MRNTEFPNRPNGYDFINWLYCPECGGKAGIHRSSPNFELRCNDCAHSLDVILGQSPPFHKVEPRHIEEAAEQNQERGALPHQQINPGKKLREMADSEVAQELQRAGYHDLADTLNKR